MDSKNRLLPCLAMAVMVIFGVTKADIEKDKQQCADKLVGLAPCLPYVGGEAPAPPKDCCTGLKQVLTNSEVCLCILIKDHNDPSLNLKINDTLALGLLHLQPGSPDAKLFEDYAKRLKSNTTTVALPPAGDATRGNSTASDGGRINISWGVKIVGLIFMYYASLPCVKRHI
ncbi:hypothetical protein E3N88_24381 [Mikania micrantha]|uniref:Bifunctional inhibitor/plant lipid transfer protein/seed storage helical domain-containing protein n=1 Tax=Mikania micrantha TaxID=192012 RepID=A0A5N6N2W9_9ASTR|nr:hypothetical protein E3N88_24381 [Mikania micrantha]